MDRVRRLDAVLSAAREAAMRREAERVAAAYGLTAEEVLRELAWLQGRFTAEHPGESLDGERFAAWVETDVRAREVTARG